MYCKPEAVKQGGDEVAMVARHDDVMVADGIGQEISGLALVRQLDDLLRAAEIGFRLIVRQQALGHEITREVA